MQITLSIPIRDPDGFREVDAEFLFNLAPHLASAGTFAVHLRPNGWEWTVTNVETGLWVGRGETRSAAIREARRKLNTQTHSRLLKAYKNARKLYPILKG